MGSHYPSGLINLLNDSQNSGRCCIYDYNFIKPNDENNRARLGGSWIWSFCLFPRHQDLSPSRHIKHECVCRPASSSEPQCPELLWCSYYIYMIDCITGSMKGLSLHPFVLSEVWGYYLLPQSPNPLVTSLLPPPLCRVISFAQTQVWSKGGTMNNGGRDSYHHLGKKLTKFFVTQN